MSRILRALIPLLLLVFSKSISAYAQAPQAGFMANDTVVCINNTILFTDTSLAGSSSIVEWDWNFGNGQIDSVQHPSFFYPIGGQYTVTLIVTDGLGQKDTASSVIWVLSARAVQNIVRICSPATVATISAYSASGPGVTGTWFTSTSASIANPADTTTQVSNLMAGNYIFYWVVSDGFCSAADQVTVMVDQPISANAGSDQTVCVATGTATLAANNPAPGTGMWSTTSSAIITTPSNRNSTVTNLTTPGTYTFVWTITRGACVNTDTMQIVVNALPVANGGLDQISCSNNPVATLSGVPPSPGTVAWSTTSSATIASPTTPVTNVSGLPAGISTFIYTVTNGLCVARDTVFVSVTAINNANAGTDRQVCTATGTVSVTGNNPGAGTPSWSAVTIGTVVSPNSQTTSITGLTTPGFYSFVYTITIGTCVSRDTMVVIVRAPVNANAGTDQAICALTTATLSGNSPAPGTGVWTTTGSATITTPSSATSTVSNLATGNNTFIWSISYGACITRDTVIIRVDTTIAANAGSDQQICQSVGSVTLSGNNPTPGTGLWTRTNGGTITTPSSPSSTVTSLTAGVHGFIWSVTNGSCIRRDTMYVTVYAQIPSNAGLDQQLCQGNTTTLSGNVPNPATGLWTTTSTATITNPSSPTSGVSGFTSPGIYTFVWTVTNVSCVQRDTMRITVDSMIIANAGPNQTFCAANSATMAANPAAPGTGLWTTTGSATITTPSSASSTVGSLATGDNTFIWTITNGQCVSRDTVIIHIDSPVAANAGSDQSVCVTSGSVLLNGSSPTPGTALWTTTSSATITNPTSASTTVTGLSTPGNYSFVYTITNGSCVTRDTIVITVNSLVVADAGSDQSQCALTTATLDGNDPAPANGLWSTSGSATIAAPATFNSGVSGLLSGNNTFIWTITNGACVSSDTVIIHVDSQVIANAGADQALCFGDPVNLNGNTATPGIGVWTALNGGTITDPSQSSTSVSGIIIGGAYSFVWTITNSSCVHSDTVVIAISDLIQADAGIDAQYCQGQTVALNAVVPSSGNGTWTALNGGVFVDPSQANTIVNNLNTGSFNFVWTVVNGSCTTTDTVNIVIDSLVVATTGIDQTICATTGQVALSAIDVTPYSGTWTTNASGSFADPNSASTTFTGLTVAGTFEFIWTVTNGSCTSTDTLLITVDSNIVANAGPDQNLCETTLSTNLAATAETSAFWSTSGSAIITDINDPATSVSGLSPGANIFTWTVNNGVCTSVDTVIINVFPQVTAADAGLDGSSCSFLGISLAANSPSVGTGTWTTSGTSVITDPNDPLSTVSGLTGGVHEYVWTITNGGCISSDTVLFTITQSPVADAGSDHFVTSGTLVNLGGTPTAVSGTLPFIYEWNPGTLLNDSVIANPQYIANATQTFVVTLTDSTGCFATDTVTVYLNNPPVAVNDTAYLCMNGVLIATVTANDYDIDGDTLTVSILTPPTIGNAILSSPGVITYTPVNGPAYIDSLEYVICDNNPAISLCDTAWLHISVVELPVLTSTSSGLNCFGDTTGGVDLTASSATMPLGYVWSNADTTEDILGVPAGIYTVTVTDSLGCISTLTDTVDGPVAALLGQTILQHVNCHGDSTGAIDLTVTGGTPSYSYVWSTTDTTEDITNLQAGAYSVLITDGNGCTYTLADTILQPDSALTAILTITDVQCASDSNGTAIVVVSGGTPTYSFSWSSGQLTDTLNALSIGIYTVTVTDLNSCSVTLSDTLNSMYPPIVISVVSADPFCLGGVTGSVNASVSGGVAPYSYSWSNGDTLSIIDSLQAGIYDLTVTDSVGCLSIYSAVLNDTSSISIVATDTIICAGDTAILSVVNYAGIAYQWYENGIPLSNDTLSTLQAVLPGIYSISATAVCGMFTAGPVNMTVNALPVADAGTDVNATCDETISLTASGGVYYSWSPASLFSDPDTANTTVSSNSTAQLYVTVTDLNGCSATDSLLLTVVCDPVSVPEGFSPNADGINDFFVITGSSRYPESVLHIYNRWGNLVYEKTYYDNSFNGLSNVAMTPGEELPDGTYFYVYDLHDGSEAHKGYVVIRR